MILKILQRLAKWQGYYLVRIPPEPIPFEYCDGILITPKGYRKLGAGDVLIEGDLVAGCVRWIPTNCIGASLDGSVGELTFVRKVGG